LKRPNSEADNIIQNIENTSDKSKKDPDKEAIEVIEPNLAYF